MSKQREILHIIDSQPTSDGDGVKIRRIAGFKNAAFSPFLMLDELKSDQQADYMGGFPPHPHRGIETLTYMMQGHFQHKDHLGNVGELRSGGAQWMAAGRGVIHCEMPMMEEGQLHGFQIWINQPASDKMKPAQYFDFQPELVTEYHTQAQGLLRVLAGELSLEGQLLQGPLQQTGVPVTVADWRSANEEPIRINLAAGHQTQFYVYQGEVTVSGRAVTQGQLAQLSDGDALEMTANQPSGVLLLSGQPIHEPVVHYGPFVMNSMAEIEQAVNDYNNGVFSTY